MIFIEENIVNFEIKMSFLKNMLIKNLFKKIYLIRLEI